MGVLDVLELSDPGKWVDKATYKKRLAMCRSCPERIEKEGHEKLNKTSQCPDCRCFCYLKTKLKSQCCPYGDWCSVC